MLCAHDTERPSVCKAGICEKMRLLRRERGLSQEELAEGAALHRTYVGSVERGERNISIDNMERVAIALGVALREML
jgi:transcriptional regulator with XRE-family HTH domain